MTQLALQKFRQLQNQLLNFDKSPLYQYRQENKYHPVLGAGNLSAKLIFIGEAPGKTEALTGQPFVGAAGKILDQLLASIDLNRDQVFITSLLHDRPPNNRDPKTEEIKAYKPFLNQLIDIIKPQIIAPLGRHSTAEIMAKYKLQHQIQPISQIHGQAFTAKIGKQAVTITPLYHPAVALYNNNMKQTLFDDFQKLKRLLTKGKNYHHTSKTSH